MSVITIHNTSNVRAFRWDKKDGKCTQEAVDRLFPGAKLKETRVEKLMTPELDRVSVVLAVLELPE